MSITVLQALLITLFCIISNLMFPLLGDIGGYFGLGRPLIAGTITGLILGDVKTGMMIGASLNAVYMSSQAVGNVMSTDVTIAGYIATALSMAGSNDPAMALAAGEDGLVFYRALAEHYQRALRPGGALALEIGWQQREAVTALLEANGWADIACRKDFGGNDRCVTARRPQ